MVHMGMEPLVSNIRLLVQLFYAASCGASSVDSGIDFGLQNAGLYATMEWAEDKQFQSTARL